MTQNTLEHCRQLDAQDPLRQLRHQFELPPGVIYLDGNSLGVLPRTTAARVAEVVTQEWGQGLIRSWNSAGWFDAPRRAGDKIARLVGANPNEVVATDSTSINLFKVLSAALNMAREDAPQRNTIVSERSNFPTDLYIAQGLQALLAERKLELRFVKRHELEATLREVGSRTAVVMLTQVDYRSGGRYVMQGVTEVVQSHGALMLWDLAHSTCAFPVSLNACKADLAVGCTYKYVNAGPGAPAFVFAAKRHLDALDAAAVPAPISGWFAHEAPFAFDPKFRVARGVERFTVGTPPILQFAALEAALDLWLTADMNLVREASVALTTRFIAEVEQQCAGMGLTLASPREVSIRGAQVSFRHAEGYAIMQALIARGVIGDFRAPDILRFGFTPLYLGFTEVFDAVEHLRQVLASGEWKQSQFNQKAAVT